MLLQRVTVVVLVIEPMSETYRYLVNYVFDPSTTATLRTSRNYLAVCPREKLLTALRNVRSAIRAYLKASAHREALQRRL